MGCVERSQQQLAQPAREPPERHNETDIGSDLVDSFAGGAGGAMVQIWAQTRTTAAGSTRLSKFATEHITNHTNAARASHDTMCGKERVGEAQGWGRSKNHLRWSPQRSAASPQRRWPATANQDKYEPAAAQHVACVNQQGTRMQLEATRTHTRTPIRTTLAAPQHRDKI
jgi:hypothetical protein